jgi:hypothetical protein
VLLTLTSAMLRHLSSFVFGNVIQQTISLHKKWNTDFESQHPLHEMWN